MRKSVLALALLAATYTTKYVEVYNWCESIIPKYINQQESRTAAITICADTWFKHNWSAK